MSSLKEVSSMAGLSVSTVSHILSGRGKHYSDNTQRVVRLAAEKANYRPNLIARSLRKGQTNTIGLIVPQFYNEVIGLETICRKKGYNLQVGAHHTNSLSIREVLEGFIRMQVDGLLVFNPDMNDDNIVQVFSGRPTVVIDDLRHEKVASFVEDIETAIKLAISYLAGLGHEKIGFVGSVASKLPYRHREAWFRAGMNTSGLEVDESWLIPVKEDEGKNPWEIGYFTIKEYLQTCKKKESLPTALVANNSEVAVGIVKGLLEFGLTVPDDISIIGLMDQSIGQYAAVPITGIDTKYRQIAIDATKLLVDTLKERKEIDSCISKVYKPELIERKSCTSPTTKH